MSGRKTFGRHATMFVFVLCWHGSVSPEEAFSTERWLRDLIFKGVPGYITDRCVLGEGYLHMIPPDIPYEITAPDGLPVTAIPSETHREMALAPKPEKLLQVAWSGKVGEGLGLWVSVPAQRVFLLQGTRVIWWADCSTAAAGTGFVEHSLQTPTGWHRVCKKIGESEPWGRIFKSRAATNRIWQPGQKTKEDLVLTRILWLEGQEPGKNQGRDRKGILVDSRDRFIYIHGTNDELHIGLPTSRGCIRLSNDKVIELFSQIPEQTPVFIEE